MSARPAGRRTPGGAEFSSPACFLHEIEGARCKPRKSSPYPVRIKRVYEPALPGDGERVLVDRLWPRGLTRERAAVDAWHRAVAPSPPLRRWFGHDRARWSEFRRRYIAELRGNPGELESLRAKRRAGPITLLFAARDPRINHAVVLRDFLLRGR